MSVIAPPPMNPNPPMLGAPPQPDTPLVALARVLEGFPRYLFEYLVNMAIGLLTDPLNTSLGITSGLLVLIVGWQIAIAAFFGAFTAMSLFAQLVGATGSIGQNVGGSIRQHAQLMAVPPSSPPSPPPPAE